MLCEVHNHKVFATSPTGKKVHMLTVRRDAIVVHQIPFQLELFCECGEPLSYYEEANGHIGRLMRGLK